MASHTSATNFPVDLNEVSLGKINFKLIEKIGKNPFLFGRKYSHLNENNFGLILN